ncbi:MAG: N-acetylmuramoyl-L-alanine amidase [Pseudomonadales bacterium]|nr:N-acetylmuramoyl-L-alanine amidase [Pseudomonadales bacterium]
MLDAGHTKERSGAISATGKSEYSYNKNIVNLLEKNLLLSGFKKIFQTNRQDSDITLTSRAALANAMHANIFISIHHDSVQPKYLSKWRFDNNVYAYSDRFNGFSVFFSRHNPQARASLYFALLLGSELRKENLKPTMHHAENIPGENRAVVDKVKGVFEYSQLTVLRKANMPALLLECGIIVNRKEEVLLSSSVHQNKLVTALTKAIKNYCQKQAAMT